MSNDVLITPASRKIEFKDSGGNVDAKIETDASGNLNITNAGGDISLGDTTSDVFIGDGTNSVDIVFEQNGEIRGTSGVTLTLGDSNTTLRTGTDLSLNSNDITNVNSLSIANGTQASPSIVFTSDTDNGIYRDAANRIGFAMGGTTKLTMGVKSGYAEGTYGPVVETNSGSMVLPGTVYLANSNAYILKTGTSARLHGDGGIRFSYYNGSATTEGIRLTGGASGGTVGIGTTSPSVDAGLHVRGSTAGSGQTITNLSGLLVENNGSSGTYYVFQTATSGGGKSFSITNAGDVGIGTTAPADKVEIRDNHSQLRLTDSDDNKFVQFSYSGGKLVVRNNNSSTSVNQITLDSIGSLGVGTMSPNNQINTGSWFKPESAGRFVSVNSSSGGFLMLESSTVTNDDQIGGVFFTATAGQSDAHKQVAAIDAIVDVHGSNTALNGADLRFFTKPVGAGATVPRMIIRSNGKVGINKEAPAELLEVRGNSTDGWIRLSTSSGNPVITSTNNLSFKVGSTNELLYLDNSTSRIGIGVTSPTFKLHVRDTRDGDATYNGGILVENTGSGGEPALAFKNSVTGSNMWLLGCNQDSDLHFAYGTSFTDGNAKMTVKANGDVFIGAESAGTAHHKLDVYSNENVPLRIHRPSNANLNSTGAWGIGFSTRSDANISSTDTRAGIFSYYNGNMFLAAGTSSIVADPDAYARLTVLASGNIGIGTMTPSTSLHMYKGGLAGNTGVTDMLRIELNRSDHGATPSGPAILFKDQDTNNPTNEARIKMMTVNDTDYGDNDEAASNLVFETTNGGTASDKMIITGRGDVGIGTVNPAEKLDVFGRIQVQTGEMLRYHVSSWSNSPTHTVIANSYKTNLGDYVSLKASGNSGSSHGIITVADNGFYVGLTNAETGELVPNNNNSGPLNNNWMQVNSAGMNVNGHAAFTKSASDQSTSADSTTVPSTSGAEVIKLQGGYTNGTYTTEIAKVDRSGGLPIYFRESLGTANSFTNRMRIGTHGRTNGSYPVEIFGDARINSQEFGSNGNGASGMGFGYKATQMTRAVGTGVQWIKIGAFSGSTKTLTVRIVSSGDNTTATDVFVVSLASYGFKANILKLPSTKYNSSKLEEIRTKFVSGATYELWIKMAAITTSVGYLNVSMNDSGCVSTLSAGTEPTVGSNDATLPVSPADRGDYAIQTTNKISAEGGFAVGSTTRINNVGDIIGTSYYVGGTNIVDTSRNLTNIGTINSGAITLYTSDGATATDLINLPRGGGVTFYGNAGRDHSIQSRSATGGIADDIRINSYGAVFINLDSNNNNTSSADFKIGRHGGSLNTINDVLFTVSGENGDIIATGQNNTFYSGGSTGNLSVGRGTTQALHLYVDDNNCKITADQDSDSNGNHGFILDRTFDGTGESDFEIRNSGSTQLVVDKDGNVGIGLNPNQKLHVAGTIATSSGSITSFGNVTAGNGHVDGKLGFKVNGTEVINSSRNLTNVHDITFNGVVRSTNNANADGPNFNVSTTNKSTSEYAYRVDRSGTVVGGLRIDGRVNGSSIEVGGTTVVSAGRELQNVVKLKTNDGTATAPSHTFTNDTNSGMFSGGADVVKFTSGGVTGITLNSDTVALIRDNVNVKDFLRHYGDTDTYFRFTTDRIRMVAGNVTFMDATEGATDYLRFPHRGVTIGSNTSPQACLTIEQNSTVTPASGGGTDNSTFLRLDNSNTTASASSIIVFNADDAGGNTRHGAAIQFKKSSNWGSGSGSYPGELYFWTRPSSGNQAAAQKLDKDGNAIFKGNVTAYGSLSDRRLKENIENIPDATEKVQQLNGVTFNYKKDGRRSTGLIAQELQEVLPEAVYTTEDIESGEEHLAIHYGNTIGLLVNAIKEQQAQIDNLTKMVNELKEK